MAKHEVHVCDVDLNGTACGQPARTWTMWLDGERQAHQVDLCQEHSAPLQDLLASSQPVDLPVRPRATMQTTKLKATPRTAPLKKR
jgi:hypothetical protein